MTKKDYYEILGVVKGAETPEIKKAYRQKALEFHPDRNNSHDAEERFKEASEAYEVLSDPQKRRIYDQFGHAGLEGRGFHGFEGVEDVFSSFGDIFEDFFGGMGGFGRSRSRRSSHPKGGDLEASVTIDLKDVLEGVKKEIEIYREVACEQCSGSGSRSGKRQACSGCNGSGHVAHSQGFFMIQTACPQCRGAGEVLKDPCYDCRGQGRVRKKKSLSVKVPAGVEHGMHLILRGEGHFGQNRGVPGDLYVSVRVNPHPFFQRQENNIHCEVPVSFTQAALGATLTVPTLEGETAVHLPVGIDSGEELCLKKKGLPGLRGGRRGDQIIRIRVKTPKKLSKAQKKLLEELDKI